MAHHIPYVATASVSNLHDLEHKVSYAMSLSGARYIHVLVPCPLGWGFDPCETILMARLAVESGLFPLFEAEHGRLTRSTPLRRQVPVDRYLERQKRFAHLFAEGADPGVRARIQQQADEQIKTWNLTEEDGHDH